MKPTAKHLQALTYLALCVFCVNCGDSDFSPVSPSPVVSSDVGPSHDVGPSTRVGESSYLGPLGDIGPAVGPGNTVSNTNSVARDFFQTEMNVFGHSRLRLEAVNGGIQLMGSAEADRITITGERLVGSESMEDAEQHLRELEVQVMDLGDEILVKTVQPENGLGRSYQVNYTIFLPHRLEVSVESINGNVELREIFASAYVELINGRIEGEMVLPRGGTADLNLVNGDIDLRIPVATSAEFSAQLSNGSISLSNLSLRNETRDRFSLRGTLGDGYGRIELRTTNGSINTTGY
jgi:hypothetical protein